MHTVSFYNSHTVSGGYVWAVLNYFGDRLCTIYCSMFDRVSNQRDEKYFKK